MEVTQLFTFWRPQNECKSAKLRHLTHKQHDILYAVSGCSDVKFRIGNLNEAVRPDAQGQGRGGAVQVFQPQRAGAGFMAAAAGLMHEAAVASALVCWSPLCECCPSLASPQPHTCAPLRLLCTQVRRALHDLYGITIQGNTSDLQVRSDVTCSQAGQSSNPAPDLCVLTHTRCCPGVTLPAACTHAWSVLALRAGLCLHCASLSQHSNLLK